MLAGGAWKGRMLARGDEDAFVAEMRRWGMRHVLVWSKTSRAAFGSWGNFSSSWADGPWQQFDLLEAEADLRSVVTGRGEGQLVSTTPLGGLVRLTDARRGDRVVVRTRFHPAWTAEWDGGRVPLIDVDGQLGFVAPADGRCDVRLVYPTRHWLLLIALAVVILVAGWEVRPGNAGADGVAGQRGAVR